MAKIAPIENVSVALSSRGTSPLLAPQQDIPQNGAQGQTGRLFCPVSFCCDAWPLEQIGGENAASPAGSKLANDNIACNRIV
jgi:hypothetical protein